MKRTFIILILLFISSVFMFGQEKSEKVLTVDEAVSLALKNNLTVKQSKMDLDLLDTKSKFSWNSASPSFNLTGGANGSVSGPAKEFNDNKSSTMGWSAGGGVSVALTPALGTAIKAAKLSYEAGELSLEAAKRSIELNVIKTFYQLLFFNENIAIQKRSLETAKQTYESNRAKYNLGRLSEVNLLNSQYSYESKIPVVANLENTYESNLDNFKIMIGLDLSQKIELTGSLDDIINNSEISADILNSDVENIPSVVTLKKNIESVKNALTASRFSAYSPSLSLSGNVSASGNQVKKGDMTVKNDPSLSITYSANVRIPLDGFLPWSNGALNIKSQKESLEKLEMNLESAKTNAKITIRNQYNSIMQAKAQLALYEKNETLVQKTYDMTKASYNAGAADLLTLQNAENNLYQAKYNVQNQRYTIISAILDMENTLGLPFGSLNK